MPKSTLQKQKEAEDRAKARSKRSPQDQIAHLDSKFGQGLGAAKERKRLSEVSAKKEVKEETKKSRKRKKDEKQVTE